MMKASEKLAWLTAAIGVFSAIAGPAYLMGSLSSKVSSLDKDLQNTTTSLENKLQYTTNRLDGLYTLIVQQGGDIKKAVSSSKLNPEMKKQILDSLTPFENQLRSETINNGNVSKH